MAYPVLFFGSASFSIPLMEGLTKDPLFKVIGVVTQPDRPTGRKNIPTPPPVKRAAINLSLPVYQYEDVKTPAAIEELRALRPDVLVVASFGQIMPQALLDIAPRGAINFHWSLLPKYRGASPVQGALLNGDTTTGATIMLMDKKMDHGAILRQFQEPIQPDDTSDTIYHRLGNIGTPLLCNTIADYLEGRITPQKQDHSQATFVPLLSREDGKLDPTKKPAIELERAVRAYQPWPGTFLDIKGKRIKVLKAKLGPTTDLMPGSTFISGTLPAVSCVLPPASSLLPPASLLLLEVQPEGKNVMDGATFLRGRPDWDGHATLSG